MCRNRKSVLFIFFVGFLVAIASFPGRISAQGSYPSRPITLIIDQGAGGMTDVVSRVVAKAAEKELGQPIVCDNRAGGEGAIAVNALVKSKPDGYTLGVSGSSMNLHKQHMEALPFDVRTDTTDIAAFVKFTHALCVRTDAPWKTFEEVVAYARQNPGKFNFATAGLGATAAIVMARIAMKEGIKWSPVPFKSGSESMLAAIGGHVNATTAGPADVIPHIQSGKLRLIFSLTDTRWPIAPTIPSVLEKYGFWVMSYKAIIGPVGIPDEVVEKVQNAIKKAVDDPAYVQLAKTMQVDRQFVGAKDYSKLWRSQYDEMGNVIRALGLGK